MEPGFDVERGSGIGVRGLWVGVWCLIKRQLVDDLAFRVSGRGCRVRVED